MILTYQVWGHSVNPNEIAQPKDFKTCVSKISSNSTLETRLTNIRDGYLRESDANILMTQPYVLIAFQYELQT